MLPGLSEEEVPWLPLRGLCLPACSLQDGESGEGFSAEPRGLEELPGESVSCTNLSLSRGRDFLRFTACKSTERDSHAQMSRAAPPIPAIVVCSRNMAQRGGSATHGRPFVFP